MATSAPHSDKSFLDIFDAAAPDDQYKLVREWISGDDDLCFYEELREKRPYLVTPEGIFVSRYVDVCEILQCPRTFTTDHYRRSMGTVDEQPGYLMAHDDDALHTREKALMTAILNRDDAPIIREMTEGICRDILGNADGQLGFDLVPDYCRNVPATVAQQYFGYEGVSRKTLSAWSYWLLTDVFHNQPFEPISNRKSELITQRHAEATKALRAYVTVLFAAKWLTASIVGLLSVILSPVRLLLLPFQRLFPKPRRRNDTIATRLIRSKPANQAGVSVRRLGINLAGLLVPTIEMTSAAAANVVNFLVADPDRHVAAARVALRGTREDFDRFVWEALRFAPLSPYMYRRTSKSLQLAGGTAESIDVAPGTTIFLLTKSAMFDASVFPDATSFDPSREHRDHFTFGFGPHACLGKHVAMAMVPEMVRQVLCLVDLSSQHGLSYRVDHYGEESSPFPEHLIQNWTAKPSLLGGRQSISSRFSKAFWSILDRIAAIARKR